MTAMRAAEEDGMRGRWMRRAARPAVLAGVAAGVAAAAVMLAGACTGEDRPNVEVIGGEGVVSISGAFEGDGPAQPSGRRYAYSAEPEIDLAAALDLRVLRSVVNVAIDGRPVEWARATAAYAQGRNQQRADGTVRSLADLAADPAALAVFPDGPAVYGRASFIDGIVRDAIGGGGRARGLSDDARRALVDGGVQMALYAGALHRLDAAQARMTAGETGANALVDGAWALIAGPVEGEDRTAGLLPMLFRLEADLQLERRLEQPLELAFIDALAAAEGGDAAAFTKAAVTAREYLNAYFALATLRAARAAEGDTSEAARQSHLAEGWVAFQAIRATVAGAAPDAAQRVTRALERPAAEPFPAEAGRQVGEGLNDPAVLAALGIPAPVQVRMQAP